MSGKIRPRVAVSSCLLGEPVRFNGGHSKDRFLTGVLSAYVDWVPICPEMEIGLGSPREALRLERSSRGPRLMTRTSRRDLTGRMTALTAARAAALDVDGFVFKSKSPSCGIHGIPVYQGPPGLSGDAPGDRRSRGMFANGIIETHPALPVEDEGRLHDEALREAFIERIFAHGRLRTLFEGDWRPRDLVAFHARHKMQILAHDPARYRAIGRIVAQAGALPREQLAIRYAEVFRAALAAKATIGRIANVLKHCLGMLGDRLDPVCQADLLGVIHAYRAHHVPLCVPVTLLRHHARGAGKAYLTEQTFFDPFPEELCLRNHVPA